MDLLGSILSTMDVPPPVNARDRLERKRQEELVKKVRDEERDRLKNLKDGIDEVIDDFLQNPGVTRTKLEPMEKIARKIVHEAAESVGLVSITCGTQEGVDRHVVLFKKEGVPCDAELACLRSGRPWDPEAAAKERRRSPTYEIPSVESLRRKRRAQDTVVSDAYVKKYERIVGSELSASKVTVTKNHYGYVPTENKKDSRSIEQTLADIKAKKRKRAAESTNAESDSTLNSS